MINIIRLLVVHCAVQLALILDIYLNPSELTLGKSEDWLNADATLVMVIVMGIFCLSDLIALSLMIQLWMFHIKLQKEGLTTYQFIVKDNQRRREEQKKTDARERKRDSEILKALAEKRKGDAQKLKLGGQLRRMCGFECCDPLEQPKQSQPNDEEEAKESDS